MQTRTSEDGRAQGGGLCGTRPETQTRPPETPPRPPPTTIPWFKRRGAVPENVQRAALALALLAATILGGLLVLEPVPLSDHALAARLGDPRCGDALDADATLPAARLRVAIWGGHPAGYDEERGTTLVAERYCNHALRDPAFVIQGDFANQTPRGPLLLRPVGDDVRVEGANLTVPTPLPPGTITTAVGEFRATSPWPPFLAYVGSLTILLGAAPLALREPRAGVTAAALAAIAIATLLRGGYWLLAGILLLPVVPATLVGAGTVAFHLARRAHIPTWALALFLAGLGFLATARLTFAYFPTSGAGD